MTVSKYTNRKKGKWDTDEEEYLQANHLRETPQQMADHLNRTCSAVMGRCHKRRLSICSKRRAVDPSRPPEPVAPLDEPDGPKTKKRKCLSCPVIFDSWGPGNRFCPTHRPDLRGVVDDEPYAAGLGAFQ